MTDPPDPLFVGVHILLVAAERGTIGIVAVLWVLSLLVMKSIVIAQVYAVNPVTPRVVAGPDFGFRIEGEQNGVPVGLPVVRVNGRWIEVKVGSGQHQPLR